MLTEHEKTVLFHFGYEWWMFRAAADLLQTLPGDDDPVRNALIESLAIHGRNLTCFFFDRKQWATDWNVTDLGHGLTIEKMPSQLATWRDDASKRCAHLTITRQNPLGTWDVDTGRRLIKERVDHVRKAFGQDMPEEWTGDLPTTSKLLVEQSTGPDSTTAGHVATGSTSTPRVRVQTVTGTMVERHYVSDTTGPVSPKRGR